MNDMDEHEVGYIALHVHTAIEKEKLSQAMQIAQAVKTVCLMWRKCIG